MLPPDDGTFSLAPNPTGKLGGEWGACVKICQAPVEVISELWSGSCIVQDIPS